MSNFIIIFCEGNPIYFEVNDQAVAEVITQFIYMRVQPNDIYEQLDMMRLMMHRYELKA